jgi:hypothetical protein
MVVPAEFSTAPTATTVPSLRAVTPVSVPKSGIGLVTMLQLVPFQFSMAGKPTAQMSLAETAALRNRKLLALGFGFGLETTLKLVPSQRSISALLKPSTAPTAHTSLQAAAATPVKVPPWKKVVPIRGSARISARALEIRRL